MPFDGITTQTSLLSELMSKLNIQPVPDAVFREHLRKQEEKYPGSWAYHHQEQLRDFIFGWGPIIFFAMTILSPFVAVAAGAMLSPFVAVAAAAMLSFSFAALILFAPNLRLRAPARWTTTCYPFGDYLTRIEQIKMPPAVADLVKHIAAKLDDPWIECEYGELRRETVLLDPYLALVDVRTRETAVLAIWDGKTVLHIASR